MSKIIIVFLLVFYMNTLSSEFHVVQTNPNNYQYFPATNEHRMTDGSGRMQATALWNNESQSGFEKIDLRENFLISVKMNFGDLDEQGADGIAFVLQNQGINAIGSLGVGLGFAMNYYDNNKRVYPSFGIEFDTWFNHEHPLIQKMIKLIN